MDPGSVATALRESIAQARGSGGPSRHVNVREFHCICLHSFIHPPRCNLFFKWTRVQPWRCSWPINMIQMRPYAPDSSPPQWQQRQADRLTRLPFLSPQMCNASFALMTYPSCLGLEIQAIYPVVIQPVRIGESKSICIEHWF